MDFVESIITPNTPKMFDKIKNPELYIREKRTELLKALQLVAI